MRTQDDRETSLVIDHAANVFHCTTNRTSLLNHWLRLAEEHGLTTELSDGQLTLTNVSVKLLSKLSLATYSASHSKQA